MKIRKMLLISKAISVSYSFSVSIENHPCNRTKEKMYNLFVYNFNIFTVIDLNEHINTILYLLHTFSDVYMLDSDQEPSYLLSFITA